MARAITIFVVSLLALVPICVFVGYGIGHVIAMFVYSAELKPDTYKVDRELFAGVYGIMFIGSFLYLVSALFAAFRLIKALRVSRS